MNKPLIVLQARTGSTRLPQKMIKPFFEDKTIPEIIITSLKEYFNSEQIVLATSNSEGDDELAKLAEGLGVQCFRGSENDVLNRFILCAKHYNAEKIVRICADNPFLLPEFIPPLLDDIEKKKLDYCSFEWEDGTPVMLSHIGVFAEAMTIQFLESIADYTDEPIYREHVTNYLYTNREKFKYAFLKIPSILTGRKNIRLTVDTQSDFETTQILYKKAILSAKGFKLQQLIELIDRNPELVVNMENQIKENAK